MRAQSLKSMCSSQCRNSFVCDMTHSYVWRDSFICVTWPICVCIVTKKLCVTWLIHMCDMTHNQNTEFASDICSSECWNMFLCDVRHSYVWHDAFVRATWLIYMCDVTHIHNTEFESCICSSECRNWFMCDMAYSYVWHDAFIWATWLIHVWRDAQSANRVWILCAAVSAETGLRVTWGIHMCDMTRIHMCGMADSYLWHGSFICVTWRTIRAQSLSLRCRNRFTRGMAHWYVWQGAIICVTWLIHMCGMAHSCVWHGSFMCVTWRTIRAQSLNLIYAVVSVEIGLCVTCLNHMCDVTHLHVWHDSCMCATWLIHTCDMAYSYVWRHAQSEQGVCIVWGGYD